MPRLASSPPDQGPAVTMATRASTGLSLVRSATSRPSSARPATRTPVRISATPPASAASAWSAAVTHDSGSSSAGPPVLIAGNCRAASAAGNSSHGAPACLMASCTVLRPAPKVSCGTGSRMVAPGLRLKLPPQLASPAGGGRHRPGRGNQAGRSGNCPSSPRPDAQLLPAPAARRRVRGRSARRPAARPIRPAPTIATSRTRLMSGQTTPGGSLRARQFGRAQRQAEGGCHG